MLVLHNNVFHAKAMHLFQWQTITINWDITVIAIAMYRYRHFPFFITCLPQIPFNGFLTVSPSFYLPLSMSVSVSLCMYMSPFPLSLSPPFLSFSLSKHFTLPVVRISCRPRLHSGSESRVGHSSLVYEVCWSSLPCGRGQARTWQSDLES